MPKSKLPPSKNEHRSFLESVSTVLFHHGAAECSFQLGVVHAAIAGLELQHQKRAIPHGKWLDTFAENYGDRLSERLGQKYMQVAEGLKLKARHDADGALTFSPSKADTEAFLAKRPGQVANGGLVKLTGHFERRFNAEIWRLLDTAPSRLTEAQRTRLAAAVESIADGETMASLVEAYRLTKRPTRHGAAGGYRPDEARVQVYLRGYHPALEGTLYAALPEEVQAGFRKWVAAGDTDETQLALNFAAPMFNAFEDPDFTSTVRKLPTSEKQRMLDHAEALVRCLREDLRRESRKAA